jgi:hypothetical protein
MSTVEQRIPLTEMDHADRELMAELLEAVTDVAQSGTFTGGAAMGASVRMLIQDGNRELPGRTRPRITTLGAGRRIADLAGVPHQTSR